MPTVATVAYVTLIIMFQVVMYVQTVMGLQKGQLVILWERVLQVASAKRGGGGTLVVYVLMDSTEPRGKIWIHVVLVRMVSTGMVQQGRILRLMLVSPAPLERRGMVTQAKQARLMLALTVLLVRTPPPA